ncbi:hypothetical protein HDU89_006382 [Geranomyces variabilis]|nr:hypothetical protein HDU89_006382 [Geranomyces variabilis]
MILVDRSDNWRRRRRAAQMPGNAEVARAKAAALGVRERVRKIRALQERGNSALMLTAWHGDDESTKEPAPLLPETRQPHVREIACDQLPFRVPISRLPVEWAPIKARFCGELWEALEEAVDLEEVDEILLREGRPALAWSFGSGKAPVPFSYGLARRWIEDAVRGLTFDDLQRAAFPDHLHRMSVEYISGGKRATALSVRIARVIEGPAMAFPDLLVQNRSILIAAPPARGKTTLLRDFVRLLQELAPDRKVLLVDRSDEIGGASDIPHRCLGSNVQVLRLRGQPCAKVMARAFRNHSADVVVVDEIGGADEASMVLDLKSRGVTVIATCHGGLAEVLKSKALGRLLGGITSSTIGDEQAQSLVEFNKKRDEREGDSVFDTVVKIAALRRWVIHHDVDAAVDACLKHEEGYVEIREMDDSGALWT